MIKIVLKNEQELIDAYQLTVAPEVVSRLNALRTSLLQIQTKIPSTVGKFKDFKDTTEQLVSLTYNALKISGKNPFDKLNYKETLQHYLDHERQLPAVAIVNAIAFIDELLDKNNQQLKELLICDAKSLKTLNDQLVTELNGKTSIESKILKIAFDYAECDKITEQIKKFFADHNIINYCPYCNMAEVEFKSENGKKVAIAALDHFHDKAKNNLLGYSFFNLIPTHENCNGAIAKGAIEFTKEYHLNPHLEGAGNHLTFKAVKVGDKITSILLEVRGMSGDEFFDKLLGDTGVFDNNSKKGNINVFNLKGRYEKGNHVTQVDQLVKNITNRAQSRRSIWNFLHRLGKDITKAAHLEWYQSVTLTTPFEEKYFNEQRYSKLFRDLHDEVFEQKQNIFNQDVIKIIAENP